MALETFNPSIVQPALDDMLPIYTKIEDCIKGSKAIKDKGIVYLPMPDPTNESDENIARYKQYLDRAIFYNITARTVHGLVGMAFDKPMPVLVVPKNQEYLLNNIDGSGLSLEQQAKRTTSDALSLGRGGLWVDYSKEQAVTQKDVLEGKVRAVINFVKARNIIWAETKEVGVTSVLSLIILKETYSQLSDDNYRSAIYIQYRILKLTEDNIYQQEVWREEGNTGAVPISRATSTNAERRAKSNAWVMHEESIPVDDSGTPFDYIPFTFVGSENNDITIDDPPMLSIADLNIGHYRNSADNEESAFISGQPTVAISGLTQGWVKDVLKGKVRLGARGGLPLPEGASAELLQPDPNTMPADGMKTKEAQMAAIGAQLVTDSSGAKTATEIDRNSVVENSVLSSVISNVESAYQFCFDQVGRFIGVDNMEIELNKDFGVISFDPNTYTALVNGMMQGSATKEDIFNYLKSTGMVDSEVEYDEWIDEMENTLPPVVMDVSAQPSSNEEEETEEEDEENADN